MHVVKHCNLIPQIKPVIILQWQHYQRLISAKSDLADVACP